MVYQPLRSPKSPYAKFGPGSSRTLPAKFRANRHTKKAETGYEDSTTIKTPRRSLVPLEHRREDDGRLADLTEIDKLSRIAEGDLDFDTSILPRFLHSPEELVTSPNNNHLHLAEPNYDNDHHDQRVKLRLQQPQLHLPQQSSTLTTDNQNEVNKIKQQQQQLHQDNLHQHHFETISKRKPSINSNINHDQRCLSEADNRSSSEDYSNASSDQMSCGYFSEDSNQSITDLCGCPLELKVQVKQYSDEKLLKKNLSQDNLLNADYISRPNEKCKY